MKISLGSVGSISIYQRNDGSRILTDRINNRDYRESETPAETEWVPELYGMDCRLRTWNGQQYNGLENREAIPTTRANIVILHLYR